MVSFLLLVNRLRLTNDFSDFFEIFFSLLFEYLSECTRYFEIVDEKQVRNLFFLFKLIKIDLNFEYYLKFLCFTSSVTDWHILAKPLLSIFNGKSSGAPRFSPFSLLSWHRIRFILANKIKFYRRRLKKKSSM